MSGNHKSFMQKIYLVFIVILPLFSGCYATDKRLKQALVPTDVLIIRHHVAENYKSLEELVRRLYLKNPIYENNPAVIRKKLQGIFHGGKYHCPVCNTLPSYKILEAAFDPEPAYHDRVFLLGLGLVKGIRETYNIENGLYLTSLEIPAERLKRLYINISQVNWRLKTYRDKKGNLLFLTNEAGKNGYINMGYEVIMTRILTRIQDDIYLRGGALPKLTFNSFAMFLPVLLF